ncbi:uncharacterized membrane protein YjjP (DUF1212 family) [Virgibacillus natechei]|uniref:Uncharacterized membrane protein YjjP (DUF1212 family) n=1 Tax=Virgibacillus natechei TaxID=1216297 RepID=A0ABS4IM70_9BACI|nr:threonine/serine exporter family protein [Virgibacillus natechei]MBP1971516.1 uncharacterized membrane protein YjjP (DUF1212 family) [Virgibacillus natechei]UZD12559.1 threonine/serine exporter family protein [Virgibacillus natechei]
MTKDVSTAKVCLLAGKIMLKSGAETYRVEDTMNRIAAFYGLENAQSYATPTGVNFSVDFSAYTNFMRITTRSTDLHKIAEVNRVSRKITAGKLEVDEAFMMLERIEHAKLTFPAWMQIIAAAFVSGAFSIMFGGTWPDFIPAFIAGGAGFSGMIGFDKLVNIRFISEFFGAFVIGLLAVLFISIGFGSELDNIIIGAVMPLVPGLHITNAVRDLMAGHLVAGLSKGVEALLTAFAIGAGVAVIVGFL